MPILVRDAPSASREDDDSSSLRRAFVSHALSHASRSRTRDRVIAGVGIDTSAPQREPKLDAIRDQADAPGKDVQPLPLSTRIIRVSSVRASRESDPVR
ncbi:MAG: hypothetical protein MUE69_06170 [Myxococcota bacterium]|jgi:hypothetical protein|nr:hypothetical protein [Myxococcota bacterium]